MKLLRFFRAPALTLTLTCHLLADDAEKTVENPEAVAEEQVIDEKASGEEKNLEKVVVPRTSVYDGAAVKELYKEYKQKNEEREKELPAHLRGSDEEVVDLETLQVDGQDARLQRRLAEQISPRPRQRLARIAQFDPDAANQIRVTQRDEEAFFAGQNDPGGIAGNPGGTANLSGEQLAGALDKAVERIKRAFGKKRDPDAK